MNEVPPGAAPNKPTCKTPPNLHDRGSVVSQSHPAKRLSFEQLADNLAHQDLLVKEGGGYRPMPSLPTDTKVAAGLLSASIGKYPGHQPEALICGATPAEPGPVMRGEKEAIQVLFTGGGADLPDQFCGDDQSMAGRDRPGRGGSRPPAPPEVQFKTFDLEKPGTAREFDAVAPSGNLVRRFETNDPATDDMRRSVPAYLTVSRRQKGTSTELDGSKLKHDVSLSDHEFPPGGISEIASPRGAAE